MNERTRRAVLGAGIPAAVAALGLGPYLAYRSDLPDRVASHYSIVGGADGSMATGQFLIFVGTLMVLGWVMCAAIALTRRRLQPMVAPTVSFVGAFFVALASGILATTAIGQRGLDRWQDASLPLWVLIFWIAASLIVGSVAARIASSLPAASDAGIGATPPAMDLAPGERAFWTATLSARWPLLLGPVVLLVALGLTQVVEPWFALVLLVPGIATTTFSRIRVTADRSGLQVRYGFLGWPGTSVPLHRIATAQAIDVHPTEWGGWGYRGNLTLMNRAAVVLRAGPGIRLDLHDGKVFVVTIDDPDTPARLLNAEAARLELPSA
ncbi:MAG: hypothetical protein OXD34_11280 [bacterium]|nr:hypothetical protein [bacterium]